MKRPRQLDKSPFTSEVLASMQACVDHARDLVEAANAVRDSGKPNIAYHLAALALEELGRRELIGFRASATATNPVPPAWLVKHTQDHVQKMFWAFFGAMFRTDKITKANIDEIKGFAKHIHQRRIAGLYVDTTNDGLNVPSEAIPPEEADNLIGLVEARLGMASTQEFSADATPEQLDLQNWFLAAAEDDDKRKFVFSDASLSKLAELGGDARAWVTWLKSEFDAAQATASELLKKELEPKRESRSGPLKPKWRMRFRLHSGSHSVRPKDLKFWNNGVEMVKLVAVPENKRELIVELLFDEHFQLARIWDTGWILARIFVSALNLGSRGYFWWNLPRQVDKYYDRIDDLETGLEVRATLQTALRINWGERLVLDEATLRQAMYQMIVVQRLFKTPAWAAVEYYLGGLTFLSLNELLLRTETQAYGNFHACLKTAMKIYGGCSEEEPFEDSLARLIDSFAPEMPAEQRQRYRDIACAFEAGVPETAAVDLSDAGFIKIICDTYFAGVIAPLVLDDMNTTVESDDGEDEPTGASELE